MSKFNTTPTSIEVVKKKRRRPFELDVLSNDTGPQQTEETEINKVLELVKKGKEDKQIKDDRKQEIALEAKHAKPSEPVKKPTVTIRAPQPTESEEERFKSKLGLKHSYDIDKRRDSKRVVIQDVDFNENREIERRSLASIKRARDKAKLTSQPRDRLTREVVLPELITVAELANRMSEKASDVIKTFLQLGTAVTVNQTIDADIAELVILEMGHRVKRITDADVESSIVDDSTGREEVSRPPVVTIVGHVDHGKTSLLDAIRETTVTAQESGGITQHIGAYQVETTSGKHITFIDTPGHEAFTEMRSRGVSVTDIVILVVAADDGVKEQTVEAINHTKAAGVPIIVAINKIDKEGADPTRVLRELLNHGIVTESMGGDVMVVEVSALKKLNLDKLEEAILVQAEVLNLKAYLDGKARGAVIESKMTQAKGVAATLLVQSGTLKKGDIVVAGIGWGKVKLLLNDKGKLLEEATPSMPVEVIGLDVAPHAGDTFAVVDGERQARSICEYRQKKRKEQKDVKRSKSSLEELFKAASKDADKTLPLIIKGDVQGSIEAISNTINKIDASEIKISILHEAVGGINESDVALAHASKAIIIGFNVRASNSAKTLIDRDNVDVRYYSIIYEAIDDIKRVLSGMLSPIISEQYLGKAEIRTVFNITNVGKIGGSFVLDGSLKRGSSVKLIRDNVVIHTGKLKTLKRFKDDVKEVASGYECGIGIEGYNDIKERDIVEAFEVVEQARTV